jgi:hypothetical protein
LNETDNPSLRERVESFQLDEPGAALPFTSRLARENGWSHAFAGRVVREYKRFLILAMEAGHMVTPSAAVDQAWHLHLVYTRSYWKRLCRDTLETELHHEPTNGGVEEGAKFVDWYARTLGSYQRIFGEVAPADIWTPPQQRFATAGEDRWVDRAAFWLVPKPRLSTLAGWLKNMTAYQPKR